MTSDEIPKEVVEYYEMLLLWEPFLFMDELGNIKTLYRPPKETIPTK